MCHGRKTMVWGVHEDKEYICIGHARKPNFLIFKMDIIIDNLQVCRTTGVCGCATQASRYSLRGTWHCVHWQYSRLSFSSSTRLSSLSVKMYLSYPWNSSFCFLAEFCPFWPSLTCDLEWRKDAESGVQRWGEPVGTSWLMVLLLGCPLLWWIGNLLDCWKSSKLYCHKVV